MKRLFVVLACLVTAIGGSARAEPTKLRFILDWKAQGPGAWYYFARDKGYFAAEGLDVYTSPRPPGKSITRWQAMQRLWHEIGSYTAWRLHMH